MYSIEVFLLFYFKKNRLPCRLYGNKGRKSFRSFHVVFARNTNVFKRFEKKKIIFFGLNAKCTPVFIIRTQHVSPEKIEFDFKFSLVGGITTKRKKKKCFMIIKQKKKKKVDLNV